MSNCVNTREYMRDFIVAERRRIEDSFLRVTLAEKTGNESIDPVLLSMISKTTSYLALKEYLVTTSNRKVIISDDIWDTSDHGMEWLLDIIPAKDIEVYLFVDSSRIDDVKACLNKSYDSLTSLNHYAWKWQWYEDNYIFKADFFSFHKSFEYDLRVFEDGNGVIVIFDKQIKILFFELGTYCDMFVQAVEEKIDNIITKPPYMVYEDDRWGQIPIRVEYNVFRKYPEIEQRLKPYEKIDNFAYCYKESENKEYRRLFGCPEVRRIFDKYINEYTKQY